MGVDEIIQMNKSHYSWHIVKTYSMVAMISFAPQKLTTNIPWHVSKRLKIKTWISFLSLKVVEVVFVPPTFFIGANRQVGR